MRKLLVFVVIFVFPATTYAESIQELYEKGKKASNEKEYEEAAEHFRRAFQRSGKAVFKLSQIAAQQNARNCRVANKEYRQYQGLLQQMNQEDYLKKLESKLKHCIKVQNSKKSASESVKNAFVTANEARKEYETVVAGVSAFDQAYEQLKEQWRRREFAEVKTENKKVSKANTRNAISWSTIGAGGASLLTSAVYFSGIPVWGFSPPKDKRVSRSRLNKIKKARTVSVVTFTTGIALVGTGLAIKFWPKTDSEQVKVGMNSLGLGLKVTF
ncbi:MAG: hypothetical protein ABEJ24_05220 [Candidatus Magasanikbacteria bacterium]